MYIFFKYNILKRVFCSLPFRDFRGLWIRCAESGYMKKTTTTTTINNKLIFFLVKCLGRVAQSLVNPELLYVAQYPDGTSIRTLKTKTHFLRRPFQFSVNYEVFRMKAEYFSFKMKVLASLKLAKQSQKTPFCSGE